MDSNHGPIGYEPTALPLSYGPLMLSPPAIRAEVTQDVETIQRRRHGNHQKYYIQRPVAWQAVVGLPGPP